MEKRITNIGLDVHKETIAVALAEAGKRGDVREYGKITNTVGSVQTLGSQRFRDLPVTSSELECLDCRRFCREPYPARPPKAGQSPNVSGSKMTRLRAVTGTAGRARRRSTDLLNTP